MPSYSRKVQIPGKSAQDLYDKVGSEIDKLMRKASIGKFEIERKPAAKELRVQSSMVTATLRCGEGFLELDAKLSLLAAPFRSKIDEVIDRWLAKTFNLD